MIIFKKAKALNEYVQQQKNANLSVGFVPTMGALHMGHISLIRQSKSENNITICSIFVNPTQFNDAEDFNKYPRTISADILLLEKYETEVLFLPDVEEIYTEAVKKKYLFRYGSLEEVMEGAYRPGHFQGVGQVVARLLEIVEPHVLYLGQKDYQQCLILKKLTDDILKLPVKVTFSDIVREENGLAMSSRNMQLSHIEKGEAAGIYQTLLEVKRKAGKVPVKDLEKWAAEQIGAIPSVSKVDYFKIVNAGTLQFTEEWNDEQKIACVAAFVGPVRLIDNMYL